MDRQTIEDRDQRLVKKFRTRVAEKKQGHPEKRSLRPAWFLVPGLIVCGLALVFLTLSGPSKEQVRQTNAKVPVPEAAPAVSLAPSEPDVLDLADIDPPPLPLTAAVIEAPVAETAPKPSRIRISEMVTCSRVVDRQYVSPKDIFSLTETAGPVVWMTVMTDAPPLTLTHVYYHEGRRHCEVPLVIGHPRTRTWSHVTLNPARHQGAWRVDVVNDQGEVLDQIVFTVIL